MRRMRRDDQGFGMILVLGTAGIVTGLMILATTTARRSLTSSRQHVSFESAMAATEAGIDTALARTQKVYNESGLDIYASPATGDPSCNLPSVAWPWSTTPTAEQERSWATAQLAALGAIANCRQQSKSGEYV